MPPLLEFDSDGNLITQPVMDWGVASSEANRGVPLALDFVETPEHLAKGEHSKLQGALVTGKWSSRGKTTTEIQWRNRPKVRKNPTNMQNEPETMSFSAACLAPEVWFCGV